VTRCPVSRGPSSATFLIAMRSRLILVAILCLRLRVPQSKKAGHSLEECPALVKTNAPTSIVSNYHSSQFCPFRSNFAMVGIVHLVVVFRVELR
jgi:hypothetical protein